MGRLRESREVTRLLLTLTFITYTHSVPRVLGTKGSHWVVVGRETELGNWGRGEAGQALKVQGRVLSPSQDREIWAAETLPLARQPGLASTTILPPPERSRSGSQLSKGSFSQLCSSSVCPCPCLSETAPLHLCLPVPALFCLIPLLTSISILVSIHASPPGLLCLRACLTLFLRPPLSLSHPCLLCLSLVPISIPAFLLHALQLLSPFLSLRTHFSPVSNLSLVHVSSLSPSVYLFLSSLSPSLFLSLSFPVFSLHPRPRPGLRLFLVRVSIPLLDRLCGPRRDGTSLGAGPRGWIRITRLSG